MYDCHIHSNLSKDSDMKAADACEAAIKSGLEGLAFTDHLDFDYPGEPFIIDFSLYNEKISSLQSQYDGKLKILKAIEVGIQPHILDESLSVIVSHPFDYVLASVHIVNGIDPYMKQYYDGKSKIDAYELYLQQIYFMIKNLKSFDMVGHFDYITRYAGYADRTLRYTDHADIFDAIFTELIEHGRGFEINTGTYRNNPSDIEYDREILTRYRELGGELVCLGSDAHRSKYIASGFEFFAQVLRDAGFKYTVHFENRKPVFDSL